MSAARSPSRAPAQPANPRPPAGAPNVVVVVLDDLGFAQLGCFGSDIATPDHRPSGRARAALQPLPRHGAVLADARVPAHRPQPPRGRHGLPDRHADRASRATTARIPRSAATLPRVLRDAGYATLRRRQVAPGAALGADRGRAVRALAARAGLRALLRLPRRRHQPVDAGAGPRQRAASTPPRSPDEGYHLTEDLVDQAIRQRARPAARPRPRSRSSCTSRRARCTRRTRRRPSGSSATAAASTTAGRPGASACSRASSSWASCRGHRADAAAALGRRVERARRRRARLCARD